MDQVLFSHWPIAIALAALFLLHVCGQGEQRPPLPPSPPGLPLLGNLLQLPRTNIESYFKKVVEKYGPLVTLRAGPQRLVLVSDHQLAKDIFAKRSNKFSSRPISLFFSRYVDPHHVIWAMFPVSEPSWKLGRRLSGQVMADVRGGSAVRVHEHDSLSMLQHILRFPNDWDRHVKRSAINTGLFLTYGQCVGSDEELDSIIDADQRVLGALQPTASILNFVPFIDYVPGPMPWRRLGKELHVAYERQYGGWVKAALSEERKGMKTWARHFAEASKDPGSERLAAQLFIGAFSTTMTAMQLVILAAILHPEVVPWVQAQLDAVAGPERMPCFADEALLPVVTAVIRETLRWRLPVPFWGHTSTADDVVELDGKSYFIPRDSLVIALASSIDNDGRRFKEPDRFDPRRHLDEGGKLRPVFDTAAFGYGRRECVGSAFAMKSLWIFVARVFWLFDIRPAPGHQYRADEEAFRADTPNLCLKPFPARLIPRSTRHAEVATAEWNEREQDLNELLSDKL